MEIRPLKDTDNRAAFRSGDVDLDRFFIRYAGQNQFRLHVGATYIAAEADRILGFATIAAGHIESESLSAAARRGLPHYPVPVLRLARLAVDESAQGLGVGSALLRHIFLIALKMAEELGCIGIVVDAKPDAVAFYLRFGFSPLDVSEGQVESRPRPTPMFLPLELVALAVVPPA